MRSGGALRALCQLGVALWIGVALSLVEMSPIAEPMPEVETRAAPLQPQPSRSDPLPSKPAEPTRVGGHEIDAGLTLLAAGGRFPVLTCGYEHFGSFTRYAQAMTALGARFVVVERRRIQAEVDLESGSMQPGPPGPGFSPRARDYSGEPALSSLATRARERFGGGAEVMMLVPRALDAGLFGGIARVLSERGESPELYQELHGRYESDGEGGVRLRLEEGVRRDGSRASLSLLFDLRQIAAAARGKLAPEV
jgi:hypothetical protein